jgi:protein phosphatase
MTMIALPDPVLVLMVGPAGSGKSTLAERLFAPDEILSSDAFRAIIAGDAADQRATGPAFRALGRALERRLTAGQRTVIDATNLTPRDRRPWLAAAQRHGFPVAAIVLDLPLPTVHAQNAGRARVVDRDVVERHARALRRTVDERELEREGVTPVVVLRTPREAETLAVALAPPTAGPPPGPAAGSPSRPTSS